MCASRRFGPWFLRLHAGVKAWVSVPRSLLLLLVDDGRQVVFAYNAWSTVELSSGREHCGNPVAITRNESIYCTVACTGEPIANRILRLVPFIISLITPLSCHDETRLIVTCTRSNDSRTHITPRTIIITNTMPRGHCQLARLHEHA
jgi:hypothetical protein